VRPRWLTPPDLAGLEGLGRLRTMVLDLDSRAVQCREVRLGFARGISRLAGLTGLQEVRWDVPDPDSDGRHASSSESEAAGHPDSSLELCAQLRHLTGLQRLSLLVLPSCRQQLTRLEELQALRHLPFLELSSG
ncbi:hypothetical protein Agub_g9489, partial [Astrephomene gubernaculifera]